VKEEGIMADFKGFPREMVEFFENLKRNNNKEWFDSHKEDYEEYVKNPSQAFVVAMGERLQTLSPGINAIPKVNQSLFRLNRDIRFSQDKRPYKTNLGIWFWEGERKRMECSGFYFHYGEEKLMLGAGIHMFSSDLLRRYRAAVVGKEHGPKLRGAVETVSQKGYAIGVKHYKKVPPGYDASHENAEYLLNNGLTAMVETAIPDQFHTGAIIDYAYNHFTNMYPLHEWLREAMG
jgi:uncharacterized protein (TIGR02453 family)